MTADKHWRFNSEIVWHYFSSSQVEAHRASTASHDFEKYHHLRSFIYFGIGTLEAFLNKKIRAYLKEAGASEDDVQKAMHHSIEDKWKKWVKKIYGGDVKFDSELTEVFKHFKALRNEITHPKKPDHGIYMELDQCQPNKLLEALARGIITLHEAESSPFPYWLLGWNYVGMNGNPAHPFESNNQNGFLHSLRAMGFDVPSGIHSQCVEWEKQFMTTLSGYEALKNALARYPEDIEPFWDGFPFKPRLCRRWWDAEFIASCTP